MTGRRRSNSRQQQAFESLLEVDGVEKVDQEPVLNRRSGNHRDPFRPSEVQFRDAHVQAEYRNQQSKPQGGGLAQLQDMFAGQVQPEVVADVYSALGGAAEQAAEVLLSMAAGEDPSSTTGAGSPSTQQGMQQSVGMRGLCIWPYLAACRW